MLMECCITYRLLHVVLDYVLGLLHHILHRLAVLHPRLLIIHNLLRHGLLHHCWL
jgi:hypothetical protein